SRSCGCGRRSRCLDSLSARSVAECAVGADCLDRPRLDRHPRPTGRHGPEVGHLRIHPRPGFEDRVVDQQQGDRTEDRHDPARALALLIPPDRAAYPPAEERPGNTDETRDDEPARVTTGCDQLCDHADDQPEKDPAEYGKHDGPSLSCEELVQMWRP